MKRFVLLLSLLLPLAACNKTPAPATDSAATPAAAATVAPPADAGPPPAVPPLDPAAVASAAAIAKSAETSPAPVAGTDYVEIPGGQPYAPLDGKIEVVEVFGYVCPACFRFQPLVRAWHESLPADVRFTYVPAAFGPEWTPWAHAYYAAEAQGLVDRTHDVIFNEIHLSNSLPGEGDKPDEAAIAAFYGRYGVDPKQFLDTMHSFANDAKLNRAKQFMIRSGVEGTPTIVVNGKYRVLGKSYEDVLRITNQLIAQERAARG